MRLINIEGNDVEEAYSPLWAGGSNFIGFAMRVWIENGELCAEWHNLDWGGNDATRFYKMWKPGVVERCVADSLVRFKENYGKSEDVVLYDSWTIPRNIVRLG